MNAAAERILGFLREATQASRIPTDGLSRKTGGRENLLSPASSSSEADASGHVARIRRSLTRVGRSHRDVYTRQVHIPARDEYRRGHAADSHSSRRDDNNLVSSGGAHAGRIGRVL